MAAAYAVAHTSLTGRTLNIEYTATDNHGSGKHAPKATVHELGMADISVTAGGPVVSIENVLVSISESNELNITTAGRWSVGAKLTAYPFAKLNQAKRLLDIKIVALYDADRDVVAPHGIIGQSWDGDDYKVDGNTDHSKAYATESTTAAQAEGAIEGNYLDYKVGSPFSVDFKYSRFAAVRAAPRNISALKGSKHLRGSYLGKAEATHADPTLVV